MGDNMKQNAAHTLSQLAKDDKITGHGVGPPR
jgi:hypothetical protein